MESDRFISAQYCRTPYYGCCGCSKSEAYGCYIGHWHSITELRALKMLLTGMNSSFGQLRVLIQTVGSRWNKLVQEALNMTDQKAGMHSLFYRGDTKSRDADLQRPGQCISCALSFCHGAFFLLLISPHLLNMSRFLTDEL